MAMNSFLDLDFKDQCSLVLVTLLEDVAHGKRTFASIQYAVGDLFDSLGDEFDVPYQEVRQVAEAVARGGIRVLPGYVEEEDREDDSNDTTETPEQRPGDTTPDVQGGQG